MENLHTPRIVWDICCISLCLFVGGGGGHKGRI